MKKNNDKGFSLVIVLFAIVLFSVIGLSLFTITSSNAKQINITKDQQSATDLAEMGVIYYETLFIESNYTFLITKIKSTVSDIYSEKQSQWTKDSKNSSSPMPTFEVSSNEVLSRMPTNINKVLNINPITKTLTDGSRFIIALEDLKPLNSDYKYVSYFQTEGISSDGEKVLLKNDITIDLKDMVDKYLIGSVKPTYKSPTFPEIDLASSLQTACKSNAVQNLKNCLVNSNLALANSLKNFNDVIVKINGSLTSGSNLNWSDSTVYLNKNFTMGNNHSAENLVVYAKGKGNIGNTSLSGVTFIFGESSVIGNITKLTGNSKIFVNGNLNMGNITGNSTVNGATIIVNGTLNIPKIISPITNSLICALEFTGEIKDYTNSTLVKYSLKENPDEFKNGGKCSAYFKSVDSPLTHLDFLNNTEVEYK